MLPPHALRQSLVDRCQELGFTHVRVASADPAPGAVAFEAMVAGRRTGNLDWMAKGVGPRQRPAELLPGVRSAMVVGIDYHWPRPADPGGLTGRVSRYAWGRDYHNLVSKRLRKLCKQARQLGVEAYWSVDARPLVERGWAERAGLGYVGRNCLTIVPGHGSWLFLGVVMLTAELPPDLPLPGGLRRHCGRCTACHDRCPTAAFTGDGQLDAAQCISTWTIEHRGTFTPSQARGLGRWVFGCDDCQEVCPHNHRPPTALERDFAPRPGHAWLDLEWVLTIEDAALEAALVGSPLRRPGAVGLKRNAAAVLGNLGDPAARPLLLHAAAHPHPVVSQQARQALDAL